MSTPRVLVLYNEPVLPLDHPDAASEHEILSTVAVVHDELTQAGHDVVKLGVDRDPGDLLAGLRQHRPDVIFNLFEGSADDGSTETIVAGLLEWLGLPFTGCPAQAIALARDKHVAKMLLRGAGLPTPDFFVVSESSVPECRLQWPVIVKPARQDASVGLDQGSVVTDPGSLRKRVASLLERYGPPVLVEEFIHGREFNVALVETLDYCFLPISEIEFVADSADLWPIVTYDAKWKPGSRDDMATPPRSPADLGHELAETLKSVASRAFELFGCRDYARADIRVDPSGQPYILEINPNPDYNLTAGLTGGMVSHGLSHAQFTIDLVRTALARNQSRHHSDPYSARS
jgi:D-alanine-D-alanine ligase